MAALLELEPSRKLKRPFGRGSLRRLRHRSRS